MRDNELGVQRNGKHQKIPFMLIRQNQSCNNLNWLRRMVIEISGYIIPLFWFQIMHYARIPIKSY